MRHQQAHTLSMKSLKDDCEGSIKEIERKNDILSEELYAVKSSYAELEFSYKNILEIGRFDFFI